MIIMIVIFILLLKVEKYIIKYIILVVKFDYKLNDDLMLLIETFIITIVGYIEYYIVVLM